MFNQVTYKVILERFAAFAEGHYLIQKFTQGDLSSMDISKELGHPFMHVRPVSYTAEGGSRQFTFNVIFADIPRDKENHTKYQTECISDCIQLYEDLLAEIRNGGVIFGTDVELIGGATAEVFTAELTHTLSGVQGTFTLSFPWNWSACIIPSDWSVGGSGSGDGLPTITSLILRVNGTDNVVQTLLDITAGENMTIEDLGDGRVRFNAIDTATSIWGYITGNILDQTDLQLALADKADIASLGAVAFSNDYNDLDNLPTIPTTPNLQDVTDVGNTTTNDIDFGAGAGIVFDNGAKVKEGTTDAGLGGNNGVALKCSIDYEMKWEAGRLYIMEQNGITIREVSHNFNVVPTTSDDDTKGFVIGSRWLLDDGTLYVCSDNTTGNAVWDLQPSITPQVNADWNATSGVAEILNKPTIPAAQIQSDWTQTDNTQVDFIKNKPTLPSTVGDMTKAVYDPDNDGVVESSETMLVIGRNSTGATLYKGYIVYISGSTGNRPNFVKAQANAESTSAGTFGVVASDIPNNSDGYVCVLGTIHDLDTRSNAANPFTSDTLQDGDTLYLSPTTAGYVTRVKPSAPNHMVYVGKVIRTTPQNGTIVYRIQNGYELEELHNVSAQSPTNLDVLRYDTSTGLWKNDTLINTLGYTPENIANKSTSIITDQSSNTKYPSVKAVFDWATGAFTTTAAVASQITTALTGYATQAWVTSQGYITNVITALGYTPVPNTRTITINGNTQDLTADRTWTISTGGVNVFSQAISSGTTKYNNLSPTNWSTTAGSTNIINLTYTTIAPCVISGLSNGSAERVVTFVNTSDRSIIIFEHEGTSSTASNRFSNPDGTMMFVKPKESISFVYNSTLSRWVVQRTFNYSTMFSTFDDMYIGGGFGGTSTSTSQFLNGFGWYNQSSTNNTFTPVDLSQQGCNRIDMGTPAATRSTIANSRGVNGMNLGVNAAHVFGRFSICTQIPARINNGVDFYRVNLGFGDLQTSGGPSRGIFWEFNNTAGSIVMNCITNSGSGGITTTPSFTYPSSSGFVNTGVYIDSVNRINTFYYSIDGDYFIGAVHTTNFPISGFAAGICGIGFARTALGVNSVTLEVDYLGYHPVQTNSFR